MKKGQNIDSAYTPEVKNNFFTPMENSKDLILCPYCYIGVSHILVNYAGGKETSSPRFWCKACQKKFSIRHKSINWTVHYSELYTLFFTKPYELNTINARFNDFMLPESMRLFDKNLRLQKKSETSVQAAIEKAFFTTMKILINKAAKRLSKKNIDNWSIIINKYSSEQCYELDFELLKAENKGITFLSKGDKENPLMHCARCQGIHITKDGFSNIGRRRFKCIDCNHTFILRGRNLFNFTYVKHQILKLYLSSFHFKYKDLSSLENLCNDLAVLFMKENNMARITKKLQEEFTVHEMFRANEIELFMTTYSQKYKIIPSKPNEVFKKMTKTSNTIMLPNPEEKEEVNVHEMLHCIRQE